MKPLSALRPLSWIYAAAMRIRNGAYDKRLLPARRVNVPVICVGNMTTGGTGKTPMVRRAVEGLRRAGRRPGIISRGYRRGGDESGCVLVSDGRGVLVGPAEGGDEPVLLARQMPGVALAVGAERAAAARLLLDRKLCDCIVMDDGFQHRAFARDADIVLLDAHVDILTEPLLPAGHLREPLEGLARAMAVVHTKVDGRHLPGNRAAATRLAPLCPQFEARFEAGLLEKLDGTPAGRLDSLSGRRVVAVAGIGNPGPFFQSLRSAGLDVIEHPLPDHAAYDDACLRTIERRLSECAAQAIVTTAKDAVKLATDLEKPGIPWLVLQMEVRLNDEPGFDALLSRAVGTAPR